MSDDNQYQHEAKENNVGQGIVGKGVAPTVGRVVYYKAYGTPGGEFPAGVNRAAVVTDVQETNGSYLCRLCIMNPTGLFFSEFLMQGQEPGQWDWMPFQKDQQARLKD